MGTYTAYHIDKGLGIVPREVFDHLSLVIVQEDCCDQGDAFFCGGSMADQQLPSWVLTVCERAVK